MPMCLCLWFNKFEKYNQLLLVPCDHFSFSYDPIKFCFKSSHSTACNKFTGSSI